MTSAHPIQSKYNLITDIFESRFTESHKIKYAIIIHMLVKVRKKKKDLDF